MTGVCAGKAEYRVLIVGLGGGMTTNLVHTQCSASATVVSYDLDPTVVAFGTKIFGLTSDSANELRVGGCADAVRAEQQTRTGW